MRLHEIAPGAIIRHYKGNHYEIQCIARHSEYEGDILVIYQKENSQEVWARPLHMFLEEVTVTDEDYKQSYKVPRFELYTPLTSEDW